MNIVIFDDLTTETALVAIEAESSKYSDLYVDMDIDKERKFVKDKATLISGILKKLERARIDKSAEYKTQVEVEALAIKERLQAANIPFTALIDAHKEKRAKILAEEKVVQAAKDLAIQIEQEHSDAITLDKIRTFEAEEVIKLQKERDEEIARNARAQAEREKEETEERAEKAEKDRILAEAKAKRDAIQAKKEAEERAEKAAEDAKQAEIKRQADEKAAQDAAKAKLEANKKHVGAVHRTIKEGLMAACNIGEASAKKAVLALVKMNNVTINY